MDEARLEETEYGQAPAGEGWFAVNIRDAAWVTNPHFGAACVLEGDAVRFPEVGYTVHVLAPGQPNGLYHREDDQEDFLVLSGECLLIVEGEERRLRAWDFVHCPAGTEHIFVGLESHPPRPCVIFMAGGRTHRGSAVYPKSEVAQRHGASAAADTADSGEAYAPFPSWRPGKPADLTGVPFADLRRADPPR